MAAITYTATRRITSGHTAGSTYQLGFDFLQYDTSTERKRYTNRSLGGLVETVLMNFDDTVRFTATAIPSADLPLWEEFFASVSAGEVFVFDAWGTPGTPNNEQNMIMVSRSFAPRRKSLSDYFDVPLQIRAA